MIRFASEDLALDLVVDPAAEPLLLDVVARLLIDISQRSAAESSAGDEIEPTAEHKERSSHVD